MNTSQMIIAACVLVVGFLGLQKVLGQKSPSLSVSEAAKLLSDKSYTWIDVREADELKGSLGKIPQIRNFPLSTLSDSLKNLTLSKDAKIILVCRSGNRSRQAQKLFLNAGYSGAINMQGGMLAWKSLNP